MSLRKVGKLLLYGTASLLGLFFVLMLAATVVLNRAPHYQAEIKDWVHARTGYHIAFAHVAPAFRWYGPELSFDHLELRSKDDLRVLAKARGGRIGLDVWQLLRSGKPFAARIELIEPDIFVERRGTDRFSLASEIDLAGGETSIGDGKLDDLPPGTLTIRHGRLTIRHWSAELPELALRDVDVRVRRGERGAAFTFSASLPASLGGNLSLDVTARGLGPMASMEWTAVTRAHDLAFAGWRRLMPQYLSRLSAGVGGFEMTARGRGAELRRADLEFDASNAVVQLTDEPGVSFDEITGAFTLSHADDGWTLHGRRVRALRGGRRDPESEFDANWRGGDEGLLSLHARASYLRAETLLPLAGLLPQKDLRERLQDIAPTGEWTNMRVDLERAVAGDPWKLNVQAQFRGVGFAPAGRAPGLRGLNGSVAGDESAGRVVIDTDKAVFAWPSEFSQPVDLERFATTLYWRRTPQEFLVATPSIALKTRDASFSGRLAWHQPSDGGSPVLVLASSLDDGNVADTKLYLPRLLIAPPALTWLNRAFPSGHMSHADVVIQGPLRHFPFRDGSGLFLARADFDALTLDYKEGWPRAENLAVTAEFRNEGLSLALHAGRIGNVRMDRGDARFADFKTGELQVHVTASGDASDALAYLRATPLDALAEHVFFGVEARGPMQSDIDLFLPFKEFERRHTLVHAHLMGVSLNRTGSDLAATDLTGDADVDGAQVARADVHGRVLGGPVQMSARAPRNRPVTRTILVFNGTLAADALHSALSLPDSLRIEGTADWHGVLRMAPEPTRERTLRLSSNLAGLGLLMPEPLAKPVGVPLPSSLDVTWPVAGGPHLQLALGSLLRGQANLETGANGPMLGKLALAFGTTTGDPAFSDSQAVSTGGAIDHLDLAGWLRLYTPDKNSKPIAGFLRSAKFEVARIDYLGLSFMDVNLDLGITESGWRVGIDGPNVVGSVSMQNGADPTSPLALEFERLKFVDDDTSASPGRPPDGAQPGARTAQETGPRGIPAIHFHAADMIWDDRQLGDVRAVIGKVDDGIRLDQLTVTAPSFSATAKGEWRGKDAGLARVQGSLTSTDVGATMKDLGYASFIEAKGGKTDFDLGWIGAPSAEALSLATGHLQLSLDKGQLTGINPGAGRVVGLASLAALPRRLSLDFSDLTDKGLAFDTVRGDFDLREGSAYTENVLVKGPAADIGLIGRVGLKNRDYDQTAVVTGNVSSPLPLAAFAAGPVIGGAVLLFTQVFKQPLRGLARGYYRITGSWDNPIIERIKSAGAAAATAEAPK